MSKELFKMNLISAVQQLPNEDIELVQNYVEMIERENKELKEDIKYLFNALKRNDTQMTSKEMYVYDKYYLIFNKKGSVEYE